jgi:hypothetical protein
MATPQQQAETLRTLRTWLVESGATTSTVDKPEEGVAQHLTFTFPPNGPTTFHLIRVADRPLTIVVTGTTVSEPHLQVLQQAGPDLRHHAMKVLRRVAFGGGLVGFVPRSEGDVVTSWQLDVELYDEGLTRQTFFAGLRALLSKHLELIDAFNDALGARLNGHTGEGTGSAGYIR